MDWFNNDANTNTAILVGTNALMADYIKSFGVYKCPGDKTPAQNGDRVKSISMNAALGGSALPFTVNGRTYITAKKTSDLTPGPSQIFVTLDEHADWMDDSIFNFTAGGLTGAKTFREVPASYHNGAGGLSFADGHAEIHKWRDSRILLPVNKITGGTINLTGGSPTPDYDFLNDAMPYR